MELQEFADKTRVALAEGDVELANKLEKIAKNKNDPYYYSCLGWMYRPTEKGAIDYEINKQEKGRLLSATYETSKWLDNIENHIKLQDGVSSDYFFKLALSGFIKLAKDNKDNDAMSVLSDMYFYGYGTKIDKEQAKYWQDQCYLIKTGLTFDEWKKKNA